MKTLEQRLRKQRLPTELKRTRKSIKARTYSRLVDELEMTAKSCGMTKPEFILARTFGLQPRLALTDSQEQGLQNLNDCRIDMVNFASAFKKILTSSLFCAITKLKVKISKLSQLFG